MNTVCLPKRQIRGLALLLIVMVVAGCNGSGTADTPMANELAPASLASTTAAPSVPATRRVTSSPDAASVISSPNATGVSGAAGATSAATPSPTSPVTA